MADVGSSLGDVLAFVSIPFDLWGPQPSGCSSLETSLVDLPPSSWSSSLCSNLSERTHIPSFTTTLVLPQISSKLFLSEFGPEISDLWKRSWSINIPRTIALRPQGHKRRLLFLIVEYAPQSWGIRMVPLSLALLGRSDQILCFFPMSLLTSYLQSYTNHFGF